MLASEAADLTADQKLSWPKELVQLDLDLEEFYEHWLSGERGVEAHHVEIGTELPSAVRVAVARGRAPDELWRHLELNAVMHGEEDHLLREVILLYLRARQRVDPCRPMTRMEVGTLQAQGPHGRGRGFQQGGAAPPRGRGGERGSAPDGSSGRASAKSSCCFHCGCLGHLAGDCPERRQQKPSRCLGCGQPNHCLAECRAKTDAKGHILSPRRIGEAACVGDMIEEENVIEEPKVGKILLLEMVETTDWNGTVAAPDFWHQLEVEVALVIDTGAEVHALSADVLRPWLPLAKVSSPKLVLRGAGDNQLKSIGRVQVRMDVASRTLGLRAEVAEIKHCILSMACLQDTGWSARFGDDGCELRRGTFCIPLRCCGYLYVIEAKLRQLLCSEASVVLSTEQEVFGR